MTQPSSDPAGDLGRAATSSSGAGGASGRDTGDTRTAATVPPQRRQQPADSASSWTEPAAEDVAMYRGNSVLAAAARASWAAVLFGGFCMIAAGILLLVWPNATLTVVAVLIGLALVVSGAIRLYEGFTAHGESGGLRTAYVVIGLLAVLAGLYCLRHHALSILLVAFVTGVYFIMHGIADIGVAMSDRVPGRGLRAVLGVFSLAAGIIMVAWPAPTLVLLLTLVGAWLLFYGLSLIFMAVSLRGTARRMARHSATTGLAASG